MTLARYIREQADLERRARELCERRSLLTETAIRDLEATRWMPEGDLGAWAQTREGANHDRVMCALAGLRALVELLTKPTGAKGGGHG
jgi:hypothetical protein